MTRTHTQAPTKPLARTTDESCSCPIHRGSVPPTLPLGVDFADRVRVAPIDEQTAGAIYEAHHSYAPDLPNVTFEDGNHGVYLDDHLVGALSYNYHLVNKLKLYIEPDGRFHRDDTVGTEATKHIVLGNRLAHIARICIGVDMSNLASCALAHSQERFLETTDQDVDFLLTFVRNDHAGSMIRALCDKGWQLTGLTRQKTGSGNREERDIHHWRKQRWLFALEDTLERLRTCPCADDMIALEGKSYVCQQCHQWYGFEGHDWAPNN